MAEDEVGFAVPKLSLQQNNTSTASPPPPLVLHKQNKKRKREESSDKSVQNNHLSKKPKLSHELSSIYAAPSWAQLPPKQYKFELEVIKNGVSLDKIALNHKTHFIFGRDRAADILTLHPSCSRNHAVLQHRRNGQWLLFDFGSTHFTKLNHKKLHPHKYYKIDIGSIIQFGTSSRMYILNGPKQLQRQMEDVSDTETKPHINPKQSENKIQSMIHELATKAKQHKTESTHHKSTLKLNVWGLNDSDADDVHMNSTTFDEKEAKDNVETKEVYVELQSKRKQHKKLQNQLKQRQSKQRSDKALTQTECMKIEKLRSKVDALEDDIDGISIKISNILRNGGIQSTNDSYYDNDPFDDNDDFYDRIKNVIRRKHHASEQHAIHHKHALNRNARYSEDEAPKLRDYDSYKDELEHLEMKMSEIEQTLRDIEYRKRVSMKDKEKSDDDKHGIDGIVNDLKAKDHKYKTLKRELDELQSRKANAVKMVLLLRPAYFKVMQHEPERVNKTKMKLYSPKKTPKEAVIKPGSLADIAQKMKTEEQKRKEYEEKIEKEAADRLLEREEEIKQIKNARIKAMKQFENEQKKTQEKRKWLQERDEENKNKVGLIVYNRNDEDKDGDQKKRVLEKEFSKLIGNTSAINDEDEMHETLMNPADNMAFITRSEFVPPSNQTGDGKTWLNEKYGY